MKGCRKTHFRHRSNVPIAMLFIFVRDKSNRGGNGGQTTLRSSSASSATMTTTPAGLRLARAPGTKSLAAQAMTNVRLMFRLRERERERKKLDGKLTDRLNHAFSLLCTIHLNSTGCGPHGGVSWVRGKRKQSMIGLSENSLRHRSNAPTPPHCQCFTTAMDGNKYCQIPVGQDLAAYGR